MTTRPCGKQVGRSLSSHKIAPAGYALQTHTPHGDLPSQGDGGDEPCAHLPPAPPVDGCRVTGPQHPLLICSAMVRPALPWSQQVCCSIVGCRCHGFVMIHTVPLCPCCYGPRPARGHATTCDVLKRMQEAALVERSERAHAFTIVLLILESLA